MQTCISCIYTLSFKCYFQMVQVASGSGCFCNSKCGTDYCNYRNGAKIPYINGAQAPSGYTCGEAVGERMCTSGSGDNPIFGYGCGYQICGPF